MKDATEGEVERVGESEVEFVGPKKVAVPNKRGVADNFGESVKE